MSDFWTRKMQTYFERIDFDKDGFITRKDFEGMAKRFLQTGKVSVENAASLENNVTAIWDKYLKTIGDGTDLNKGHFVDGMKKLVKDSGSKSVLAGPLPHFFNAVDSNKDGYIDRDEYALFFDIIGIDSSKARESFDDIDTNRDGKLSETEFVTAGTDFFYTEDEKSPHNNFWGPIV